MTLNWVIVHGCIYLGSYPNRIVLCIYFLRGTTLDSLWTPLLHHRMTKLLKVQLSLSVVTLEQADTSQGKGSPSIVLISVCQSLLGFYLMRLKTKNIVIVFKNMIFYISYSFSCCLSWEGLSRLCSVQLLSPLMTQAKIFVIPTDHIILNYDVLPILVAFFTL